eukprot:3450215-Prymnesium_polylepis.1
MAPGNQRKTRRCSRSCQWSRAKLASCVAQNQGSSVVQPYESKSSPISRAGASLSIQSADTRTLKPSPVIDMLSGHKKKS